MVFVDAGAFVARYQGRDQYHRDATRLWKSLQERLITSNHVADEFATFMGRMEGYSIAADCVSDLYNSTTIEVVASTREDELNALIWMRKYADHEISFTDCVSFAMMRRYRITTAFTFDRHFRDAGFQVIGLR